MDNDFQFFYLKKCHFWEWPIWKHWRESVIKSWKLVYRSNQVKVWRYSCLFWKKNNFWILVFNFFHFEKKEIYFFKFLIFKFWILFLFFSYSKTESWIVFYKWKTYKRPYMKREFLEGLLLQEELWEVIHPKFSEGMVRHNPSSHLILC